MTQKPWEPFVVPRITFRNSPINDPDNVLDTMCLAIFVRESASTSEETDKEYLIPVHVSLNLESPDSALDSLSF